MILVSFIYLVLAYPIYSSIYRPLSYIVYRVLFHSIKASKRIYIYIKTCTSPPIPSIPNPFPTVLNNYSICKSNHNLFVNSDISTLVTGQARHSFSTNFPSAIPAARLELQSPSLRFAERMRCTASQRIVREEEERAM